MKVLTMKDKCKVKAMVTALKKRQIERREYKELLKSFAAWLDELQGDNAEFVTVLKALINWQRETLIREMEFDIDIVVLAIQLVEREDVLVDTDALTAVKTLFKAILAIYGVEKVVSQWESELEKRKASIENKLLSECIIEWARLAKKKDEKLRWERFMREHVKQARLYKATTTQTCHMVWENVEAIPEVRKVIVWNGNGLRARSTGTKELVQLVQVAIPDVLCFLESKASAEKILKIPEFGPKALDSEMCLAIGRIKGMTMIRASGTRALSCSARPIAR